MQCSWGWAYRGSPCNPRGPRHKQLLTVSTLRNKHSRPLYQSLDPFSCTYPKEAKVLRRCCRRGPVLDLTQMGPSAPVPVADRLTGHLLEACGNTCPFLSLFNTLLTLQDRGSTSLEVSCWEAAEARALGFPEASCWLWWVLSVGCSSAQVTLQQLHQLTSDPD